MNVLDLILVLGFVYAVIRGFRQGALSQVAAFGGAVAGLVVGAALAPPLAGALVQEGPGPTLSLITLAILLAVVFVGQGIGFAIGLRLRAAAEGIGAGGVDATAGIAVGAIGLVLAVWLLGSVLVQGPSPALAQQVRESRIVSALDEALPPAPNLFGRVAGYLDRQGFPQVFSGMGGVTAPPVSPTSPEAVQAAAAAGQPSTVQVQSTGCGAISSGSGFVTQSGFVVTNAHVVAGGQQLTVRDPAGVHDAVAVHFDAQLDLAVLSAPSITAPPIGWVTTAAGRETEGATLGFPGGRREMVVKPATVRARGEAVGRDIYGRGLVSREVLTLTADVRQGDSGGPFVTTEGLVGGVVFAANASEPGTGYAVTAERARPDVDAAIGRNQQVGTGECRF